MYDERYILIAYPAAYAMAGYALFYITESISKNINKTLSILFILVVLVLVAYPQFNRAESLIDAKKDSYLQVKEAGLWIKDHSQPGDIILGRSVPQLIYYSEKMCNNIPDNESEFIPFINSSKPKYLVLSVFEQHPAWVYSWPQQNQNLVFPVQAYSMDNQQPILIIYEFNYTNGLFFNTANNQTGNKTNNSK
jgi:hypothetical protein